MDYTTLCAESKAGQEQSSQGMQSLYEVCQQVTDGRGARGKRVSRWQACWWCWCWRSWRAWRACWEEVDWVKDQETLLREGLQLSWTHMPCRNTYDYALARLDRKPGQCGSSGLVCATRGPEPVRRGTEPASGPGKPAARASSRGWQSLERHRQASLWRRGATEAGAACV